MLDQKTIFEVLNDQKRELAMLARKKICSRKEESLINLDSDLAQVVIGVRRSGKSTLCFNVLQKSGVKFAYLNFDEERLSAVSVEDLNEILRGIYQVYGDFTHLFIDEVQNIREWFLFVNRLLRQGIRLLVTGSNANLLSNELATHLTGRHHQIELLPFSFGDFCAFQNVDLSDESTRGDGLRRRAFDEYLQNGGFPELLAGTENADDYIDSLVNSIVQRDIVQRFKVRYKNSLKMLANHLLNIVPAKVVLRKLQEQFAINSAHTVDVYVDYLKQAFLLLGVHKFSTKSLARVLQEKVYPVDVSLMNARKDAFAGTNLGWRLEALVYLELRRRFGTGYDIYYYDDAGRTEVDFVVCHRSTVVQLVQVSFEISQVRTRSRELRALVNASQKLRCQNLLLITAYESEKISVPAAGVEIEVVPFYRW